VIREANRAAADLLGVPADELPGQRLDHFVPPVDGQVMGEYLHRLRTTGGEQVHRWKMRLQRHDSEVVRAAVAATTFRRRAARVEGLRWLLRDVTHEEQVQAALLHAEKLSMAGKLAASLAHEIKNPLAAAMGCVDLVREALADGQDPTNLLDVIHSSLDRTSRVVSQLRELHRRSGPEEKELADVNELVERVLSLVGKQARTSKVEIVWERDEGLPQMSLMVDGIQQVFLNLVLNAIEAMERGGHLTVRTMRAHRPARVGIQFADDGPGIARQMSDRLFEPFETTKAKGSGLGLFVSQNIVQQHGGMIEVETAEGEGTTFMVWLPE
jgi:PAS domain S-box-containing protein